MNRTRCRACRHFKRSWPTSRIGARSGRSHPARRSSASTADPTGTSATERREHVSMTERASDRRSDREAIVIEHMQSENVQDWDRTIATFSHARYELPDGRVIDGRDDVLTYWLE